MLSKEEMLDILRNNVVPALGCTEPVCVALAAADAARNAGGKPQNIRIRVSRNIYKNGVSVGIAGFDKVGLDYAAALGACMRNPEDGLELMKGITPEIACTAVKMVEDGLISLDVDKEINGVFAEAEVVTEDGNWSQTVIQGGHTNIVKQTVNGCIISAQTESEKFAGKDPDISWIERLKSMKVAELLRLAESADEAELEFLMDGVEMNEVLAEYGLKYNPGIGISGTLIKPGSEVILGNGLMSRIMIRVAAATEVRLEGCPYAAMSSAGSGSKGIAVILPVAMMAEELGASRIQTLQALAFAHLLNEYMNVHIGKLSALCACAMASAPAASAAMTWLLGGSDVHVEYALRNMCGTITGMICDGGKVGCALKLGTAISAAVTCAVLAAEGVNLRVTDGICAESAEECIRNMARVGNPGMIETDCEILDIMVQRQTEFS